MERRLGEGIMGEITTMAAGTKGLARSWGGGGLSGVYIFFFFFWLDIPTTGRASLFSHTPPLSSGFYGRTLSPSTDTFLTLTVQISCPRLSFIPPSPPPSSCFYF